MLSRDDTPLAPDADTSMRAAARFILQESALGASTPKILARLEEQGIFLPDAPAFVQAITRKAGRAETSASDAHAAFPRRAILFSAGLAAALALSWAVAFGVELGGNLLHLGFAGAGGKVFGGLAGAGVTFWSKDRDLKPLFCGAITGNVAFVLSLLVVVFVLE